MRRVVRRGVEKEVHRLNQFVLTTTFNTQPEVFYRFSSHWMTLQLITFHYISLHFITKRNKIFQKKKKEKEKRKAKEWNYRYETNTSLDYKLRISIYESH